MEFEFRIEYLAEGKIKRSDQRRNGRTFCWTYAASQEEKEGHNALDLAWLGLVANFLAREKKRENYLPGCPKHCWCQQIPFQRLQKNVRPLPARKEKEKKRTARQRQN